MGEAGRLGKREAQTCTLCRALPAQKVLTLAVFPTESTFAIHKKFSSQYRPRDLERLTTKLLLSETLERQSLLNRNTQEREHRDGAGFGEALRDSGGLEGRPQGDLSDGGEDREGTERAAVDRVDLEIGQVPHHQRSQLHNAAVFPQ